MTLIDANPDGLRALPGVVTHVVTVPELGLVYTSGQVAWDKDGNVGGEGDYAKQAEHIVRNLHIALASAGATRDDLIKQTIFVVDYRPEIVPLILGPLQQGPDGARRVHSSASRPCSRPATSSRSKPSPASPRCDVRDRFTRRPRTLVSAGPWAKEAR